MATIHTEVPTGFKPTDPDRTTQWQQRLDLLTASVLTKEARFVATNQDRCVHCHKKHPEDRGCKRSTGRHPARKSKARK